MLKTSTHDSQTSQNELVIRIRRDCNPRAMCREHTQTSSTLLGKSFLWFVQTGKMIGIFAGPNFFFTARALASRNFGGTCISPPRGQRATRIQTQRFVIFHLVKILVGQNSLQDVNAKVWEEHAKTKFHRAQCGRLNFRRVRWHVQIPSVPFVYFTHWTALGEAVFLMKTCVFFGIQICCQNVRRVPLCIATTKPLND